jgi:hypothetical protein
MFRLTVLPILSDRALIIFSSIVVLTPNGKFWVVLVLNSVSNMASEWATWRLYRSGFNCERYITGHSFHSFWDNNLKEPVSTVQYHEDRQCPRLFNKVPSELQSDSFFLILSIRWYGHFDGNLPVLEVRILPGHRRCRPAVAAYSTWPLPRSMPCCLYKRAENIDCCSRKIFQIWFRTVTGTH